MPRDVGLYLEDMLEAAGRVVEYMQHLDVSSFTADPRTVDAVIRNLEILGEAAKRVPEDTRQRAPEVDLPDRRCRIAPFEFLSARRCGPA